MESDKLPVVHIITRLEPGGSAQNVIDSAAAQAADREVVLISGPHKGKEQLKLDLSGHLRYIELPDLTREISPLKDLRAFLALKKIISGLSPAIVHTHTAKAGILGRWAAYLSKPRPGRPRPVIIHTPHGHVFYGYFGPVRTFIFKAAERLTARVTDHFIALTEGERRESLEQGLGAADGWTVIHSGVSFTARSYENVRPDLGIAEDETVIATIARLERVKGVEFFIRAAAELRKRNTGVKPRFMIIGDGALRSGLEALACKLGLGKALLFTGFQRDIFKYLSAADIYVQPSLNEAMGRTAIEAQYMALPVVASDVCGLPDAVSDGVTGMLVPPGDHRALAGAIESLLKDAGLRRRMGAAARLRVLEKDFTGFTRFSAESMNIRLKNFYNKVLSQSPEI